LDTNEPIAGGVLTLIGGDGAHLVTFVAGDDGVYRISAPGPGTYYVEARRIGYRAWIDGPIELNEGEDWESEYHLRAVAVQLDPVEVTAEAPLREAFLQRVGFYERQRADFGHFITFAEIQRRDAHRVTDLLSSIPGVRIVASAGGLSRATPSFRGSVLSTGGACHPRVFIDGLLVIRGDARVRGTDIYGFPEATEVQGDPSKRPEIDLDDVVMPQDIEAIEVYRRGSEVPARFGGTSTGTQCGVIVIWTRRGWRPNQ